MLLIAREALNEAQGCKLQVFRGSRCGGRNWTRLLDYGTQSGLIFDTFARSSRRVFKRTLCRLQKP